MRRIIAGFCMGLGGFAWGDTPNRENPEAVASVLAGERVEANAAWWGFDNEDATAALQAAFDSGAERVRVPNMGSPWIVTPLQLRSDQTVYFEPGVVVLAKQGAFLGRGDSLFTARDVENLHLRGYGATLRMRKRDYQQPPYEAAEWRMGLSLRGCKGVVVEGLRIESSGGDGIYVDGGGERRWCEDITVRDVTCFDHHRQGMSVISVDGLLIENCTFANTWGTAPGAGIDFEPDGQDQALSNIVVRDSVFENNEGHEVLVYPKNLHSDAPDVSIRFERCVMRKTKTEGRLLGVADGIGRDDATHGWAGICVAAVRDDGPGGTIAFVDCLVENAGKESVRIFDKSANGALVRFENCHFRESWNTAHPSHWGVRVPINIEIRRPEISSDVGGVRFDDCHVYDEVARPVLLLDLRNRELGVRDITGSIVAHVPGEAEIDVGAASRDVTLDVTTMGDGTATPRTPNADAE